MSRDSENNGGPVGLKARPERLAGDGTSRKKINRGTSMLRNMNSRKILQLLRLHQPCSSSDLARFSGLSVPTVVSGVTQMEQIGLVKRVGKGWSSGGRPP